MSTRLRALYEMLKFFSFETQNSICGDLLSGIKSKTKTNLADLFFEAFSINSELDQIDEPFLTTSMIESRKKSAEERAEREVNGISTDSIANALKTDDPIRIHDSGVETTFQFIEREFPHLRGNSIRNKAWIDYIGRANDHIILGEIKYNGDQNPFYGFIQLLTYLSEIATPNQIERLKMDPLFKEDNPAVQIFDLHILLVDRNEQSEKWKNRIITQELAENFKHVLQEKYAEEAKVLGKIYCLATRLEDIQNKQPIECCWAV